MKAEALYPEFAGCGVAVTGGAGDIGAAIVLAFARQNARVGILDRDKTGGKKTAQRAMKAGAQSAEVVGVDLRDPLATESALAAISHNIAPLRVLVNCAGRDSRLALSEISPGEWDAMQADNLRHVAFASRAAARIMRRGAIVNLCSTSWMQGATPLSAYAAAKAGVLGLTKSLARELGGKNIRVNCVSPGRVLTARARRAADSEWLRETISRQSIPDFTRPKDVARAVLWLASDESRMCAGINLMVDGGHL